MIPFEFIPETGIAYTLPTDQNINQTMKPGPEVFDYNLNILPNKIIGGAELINKSNKSRPFSFKVDVHSEDYVEIIDKMITAFEETIQIRSNKTADDVATILTRATLKSYSVESENGMYKKGSPLVATFELLDGWWEDEIYTQLNAVGSLESIQIPTDDSIMRIKPIITLSGALIYAQPVKASVFTIMENQGLSYAGRNFLVTSPILIFDNEEGRVDESNGSDRFDVLNYVAANTGFFSVKPGDYITVSADQIVNIEIKYKGRYRF